MQGAITAKEFVVSMPYAEEQYGSKSLRRRYACDHRGVRRVDRTARTGRGVWNTVLKFLKVFLL